MSLSKIKKGDEETEILIQKSGKEYSITISGKDAEKLHQKLVVTLGRSMSEPILIRKKKEVSIDGAGGGSFSF